MRREFSRCLGIRSDLIKVAQVRRGSVFVVFMATADVPGEDMPAALAWSGRPPLTDACSPVAAATLQGYLDRLKAQLADSSSCIMKQGSPAPSRGGGSLEPLSAPVQERTRLTWI
jgi:hypothetical protein